jgi:Holliday junction resolvase RusA-like endonuclease
MERTRKKLRLCVPLAKGKYTVFYTPRARTKEKQMIKIILPLPPSVNRLWRTTKTGGMYRSPKYNAWRTSAIWQLIGQVKRQQIKGQFKLTLHAVPPDRRHRDLDNLFKAALDVLVEAKVVEDDRHCRWIEARWVDAGPACTIIIEEIGENNGRGGE